jgi:multimeric flavodoxin WrbA
MLKLVLAFNGSGRKTWNTAQLATKFLEGAKSAGAATELVHLSDLDLRGSRGCLACKLIGTPQYTHCIQKDGLTKYLDTLQTDDVVAFASPICFFAESAMMRCWIERILFQFLDYDAVRSKYPGKTKIAHLATMNMNKEWLDQLIKGGCQIGDTQQALKMVFGNVTPLYAFETLQVSDSKKYYIRIFNEAQKRAHHEKQFPIDLKNAFELGARLVRESASKVALDA